MSPVDQTLDEVSHGGSGAAERPPILFVVLEADRLQARGARYSLVGVETITVGRGDVRAIDRSADGKRLDLRFPGRWISSQHATLRAVGGEWIVDDAGSRNGTFVGGERLAGSRVLRDGDVVEAGRTYLQVRGAPTVDGPLVRDEDAEQTSRPFGLRTLLPELQDSYSALLRVAKRSVVPILLLGETGAGKEVLAREAHAQSGRGGAFVPVNCGALPTTLVESLLFGHVKGAFSGAARDEPGFVRSADGGTLFLDEIGDLPATSQAALLRVLQEHEVVPVGSTRPVKVDVRVVAATHRPLEGLAESGAFRIDLLARLKGYVHRIPPLRDRMADFGVILADVLSRVAADRAPRLTLSPEAARVMLSHRWPLNVRELQQAMSSAVALATGEVIELAHLPEDVVVPGEGAAADLTEGEGSGAGDRAAEELRDRVVSLLHENRGNVTAVARAMGKAPAQVHRWMRRFAIDPDTYRAAAPPPFAKGRTGR